MKSWSPINLAYSISKYSWSNKGFEYSAEYSFKDDVVCGYRVIDQHTGVLESPVMIRESPLNFYYHLDCTWLLDSNVDRHLTIEIGSSQNRKWCSFLSGGRGSVEYRHSDIDITVNKFWYKTTFRPDGNRNYVHFSGQLRNAPVQDERQNNNRREIIHNCTVLSCVIRCSQSSRNQVRKIVNYHLFFFFCLYNCQNAFKTIRSKPKQTATTYSFVRSNDSVNF